MYLIKLNKITNIDILKKIYVAIDEYNLKSYIYVMYNPNLKNKSYNINKLMAHFITINVKDFTEINEDDIDDIILDLVELSKNNNIIFETKDADSDLINKIEDICISYGLDFKTLQSNNIEEPVNIKKLNYNDICTIYDFFKVKHNAFAFTSNTFLIQFTIDNKGIVYDEDNKEVLDLNKHSLVDILFIKPKNLDDKIKALSSNKIDIINYNLYEPWALLNYDSNINNKITNYKLNVFDAIKNITPEEYIFLPDKIIQLLNINGYIQMKDILPIIKKEDSILEYYK